jgi:hypothetical protein
MANKKLTDLSALSSMTSGTVFLVDDSGTTQTVTGSVIKSYITSSDMVVSGNITSAGSLIPATSNTYTLGSATHKWADMYIGPNSIYIQDTANSANTGILTVTNGILQINGTAGLQANLVSGNTSLTLTPNGNINMTVTSTANVLQVTSSNVNVTGNISVSGNIIYSSTFGQFFNNANISLNTANTPQAVLFNNTIANNQVQLGTGVSNSHVIFGKAGNYRIKYTCALITTSNQGTPVYFWLRKNGTDIPHSGMQNTLSSKNTQYTVTSDFIANNISVGDYIELYWASTTNSVSMIYTGAITSPFAMPENPSTTISVMPVGA